MTQQIMESQWCPWEIGYADALGKRICIFNLDEVKYKPQFYDNYLTLKFENNNFIIVEENRNVALIEWIKY